MLPPFHVNVRIITFFSAPTNSTFIRTAARNSRFIKYSATMQTVTPGIQYQYDKKTSNLFIDAPQFQPYIVCMISPGNRE